MVAQLAASFCHRPSLGPDASYNPKPCALRGMHGSHSAAYSRLFWGSCSHEAHAALQLLTAEHVQGRAWGHWCLRLQLPLVQLQA